MEAKPVIGGMFLYPINHVIKGPWPFLVLPAQQQGCDRPELILHLLMVDIAIFCIKIR